ncbi:baseplate J/gp47 family protein [Neisseria sp. Ec49-e6-T10]|uniref:baseplate J/gp47 family protein n=1 Tax=Neisseria sp. Ec49-e6-T10 TaxID=3140744 RepID=UPI003EBD4250
MQIKKVDEIQKDYLRDLQNEQENADIAEDSDNYVRASATASAVEGNYQYADWVLKQGFASTADKENLELHAADYGLYLKPATFASGEAKFTGAVGAIVPIGTLLQKDSLFYVTSEQVIIDGTGQIIVHVVCQTAGIIGNQEENTLVQLVSAPEGIDNNTILLSMYGGTDIEKHESLLNRLLDRKRRPPAGGNEHDYYVWALSVPGVTQAFVYPLRRGLGTVDIAIMGEKGLPSEETVQNCQDHINSVRPVTAKNSLVIIANPIYINVSLTIEVVDSTELGTVENAVITAIHQYFSTLKPGQALIIKHLENAVHDTNGVYDFSLISPVANIDAIVDEHQIQWLQVGTVEVNQ